MILNIMSDNIENEVQDILYKELRLKCSFKISMNIIFNFVNLEIFNAMEFMIGDKQTIL